MLYTTYFANLRNLPYDIAEVAICGQVPDWFKGPHYKKLAPKYEFFKKWKENHDNHFYVERFNQEVLSKLDAKQVYDELTALTGNTDIALVCYERPECFCHRHLVANWFRENGFLIKEW